MIHDDKSFFFFLNMKLNYLDIKNESRKSYSNSHVSILVLSPNCSFLLNIIYTQKFKMTIFSSILTLLKLSSILGSKHEALATNHKPCLYQIQLNTQASMSLPFGNICSKQLLVSVKLAAALGITSGPSGFVPNLSM